MSQVLSSEYAGGYGGYGRRGTYGGYGGSLRKPQPPPSGLATQSLSEAQVRTLLQPAVMSTLEFVRSRCALSVSS